MTRDRARTGLTIRIEEDGAVASNDHGETWDLPQAVATEVGRLTAPSGHPASSESPLTAALKGTVAESISMRPVDENAARPRRTPPLGDRIIELGPLARSDSRSLREVLDDRRSDRALAAPDLADLATILIRGGRLRDWREQTGGNQEESRMLPSAGARHPVDFEIFTSGLDGLEAGHWFFDPGMCRLRNVAVDWPSNHIKQAFADLGFGTERGLTAVFAVAEFERTLDRYPGGSSLVWRDAGVALGGIHLCATDLGLGSCIAGSVGLLYPDYRGGPIDIGALLIGRRDP